MVNPDGVMVGNYRCSLAGLDLNRQWQKPRRRITPCVYALKRLISREKHSIQLFCDLHGHSRKKGSFVYGCHNPKQGHHKEKLLPFFLHRDTTHFDLDASSFHIDNSKAGTGRVVCSRELGIGNCYTLEASFCGPSRGEDSNFHFGMRDLEGY